MIGQALDRVLNGVSAHGLSRLVMGPSFIASPRRLGELSGVQLDFIRPRAVGNAYINR
jgi:hypothetical protein